MVDLNNQHFKHLFNYPNNLTMILKWCNERNIEYRQNGARKKELVYFTGSCVLNK